MIRSVDIISQYLQVDQYKIWRLTNENKDKKRITSLAHVLTLFISSI